MMVAGFLFLYLPIVLMIVFSFNESRLVTVWGGFSTKWYGELMRNEQVLGAAWLSFKIAAMNATGATDPRHAHGTCARALRPVPRPAAAHGPRDRAAGDAGSHHRPVAAAAVRGDGAADRLAGRARHHHDHHRAHDLLDGLRHGRRAVAARDAGRIAGGGGDGPRRAAGQGVLPDHDADHPAGDPARAGCSPSRSPGTTS